MDNFNASVLDPEVVTDLESHIKTIKAKLLICQKNYFNKIGSKTKAEAINDPEVKTLKSDIVETQKILFQLVDNRESITEDSNTVANNNGVVDIQNYNGHFC